jgi:hypothetical protein
LKTEKPDAPKSAQLTHFPKNRIKRVILANGEVYNPGRYYYEWDDPDTKVQIDEAQDHTPQSA